MDDLAKVFWLVETKIDYHSLGTYLVCKFEMLFS